MKINCCIKQMTQTKITQEQPVGTEHCSLFCLKKVTQHQRCFSDKQPDHPSIGGQFHGVVLFISSFHAFCCPTHWGTWNINRQKPCTEHSLLGALQESWAKPPRSSPRGHGGPGRDTITSISSAPQLQPSQVKLTRADL